MSRNKSLLLLIIAILLVLLGSYVLLLDPIIGSLGVICGIWTIYVAIKALRGQNLFNHSNKDEDK
ncbi:hypothetical protein [Marinilactibacillus sp. 15R]|uniref:hypothetical protein n=1 Tax=Marinilactibacillus sp. 15R TaxID=1911586 RepID=UPI0018DD4015|nr:hypothetical protein [Marinilactibacillus sp. 15R]